MAKVIGKQSLCITELKYFKSIQGIDKKTLFDRFKSLENVVSNHIDSQYRHFLAQPVQFENSITWYGEIYSHTPKVLSELQGDELDRYARIKNGTIEHFNSVIDSLQQSDKKVDAEYLSSATKFIDDKFIYCYDDKVILGVWGMQLRENVRESIGQIRKDLFVPTKKPQNEEVELVGPVEPVQESELIKPFNVIFNIGENGVLSGNSKIIKYPNELIEYIDIPFVQPKEGYDFVGWSEDPNGYEVVGDKEFIAQYREITLPTSLTVPPILPWYKRFWLGLTGLFAGRGCLKWLLWLLLLILILLILWWLLRSCNRDEGFVNPVPNPVEDRPWVGDDPNVGNDGGIYDPGNPYSAVPTPPDFEGILPPQQGVLPPIEDKPEIIPGNPSIIANRLNILMENQDKTILDLAKDFKIKYPDDKYKVVYYDNVVKRMQIEIPPTERELLKQEISEAFSPEYELFIFDESLFEGVYTPDDPAFNDNDKVWYLDAINARQAWDITRGSPQITVAIVDNGFNLKHPELESKVVMPYNVWEHSPKIFPQSVDHGTHVAGLTLAIADNKKGMSGIASECSFMPIQVADRNGIMTITSVLDGILYALYQGADVINVSLGIQFTSLSELSESQQQELIQNRFREEERLWREVMRIAAKHNSTIVVAAGNDNILAGIDPLQRPNLFITVSATDKNIKEYSKAGFSNYGSYSTLSAPGVDIYSCYGSNGYKKMEGTSAAAPIVAGAVALMKSLDSSLTTKQIICILQKSGKPIDDKIGNLIQLDKALQIVNSGEEVDCMPTASSGDIQILLSWNNYNDLDLLCTDPYGETIWYKNTRVDSGGQLEIDMNAEYPDSKTPLENIFWDRGKAPDGTYNIYLLYYEQHERDIAETPYKITVKYGNNVKEFKGIAQKIGDPIHIYSFTLDSAVNQVAAPANTPHQESVPDNELRNTLLRERDRLQSELDRVERELKEIGNRR